MAIALMAWEEKFCLGLDEIDEQHKSLVDLINQIWESIIKKSDNSVIFGSSRFTGESSLDLQKEIG